MNKHFLGPRWRSECRAQARKFCGLIPGQVKIRNRFFLNYLAKKLIALTNFCPEGNIRLEQKNPEFQIEKL